MYYFCISAKYNLMHKSVRINLTAKIKNGTYFEGKNKIGSRSFLSGHIGAYSYIGNDCRLGKVKIGRFCSISPNVKIVTGNHPTGYISTSPVFYSTARQCGTAFTDQNTYREELYTTGDYACEIGNDVWIGENVLIKGGVRIGDGAIIAMGAVVTNDIEPYTICGGVPAKVIKKRFADNIQNQIEKSKWWELPEDTLIKFASDADNPEQFIRRIKEGI